MCLSSDVGLLTICAAWQVAAMTSLGQLATLSEKLSLQCSPVLLPYISATGDKAMQTEPTGNGQVGIAVCIVSTQPLAALLLMPLPMHVLDASSFEQIWAG